jgi:urea transport system substrate-binding protein
VLFDALADSLLQAEPTLGRADEDAAAIALVDASIDEVVLGEPIDEPGDARPGQQHSVGDPSHRLTVAVGEQAECAPGLYAASLLGKDVRDAARHRSLGAAQRRGKLAGQTYADRARHMQKYAWFGGSRVKASDIQFGISAARTTVDVALLIPLRASAGIFGPSCELCGRLAAEEINAAGGLLGRELRLRVVDASGPPLRVAEEVDALVTAGEVDAIVGWQISAVRQAVAPRVAMRVPYVYTALYEGGEETPGVFLVGETPDGQLLPAMRWLAQERGVRRWCIVGNDYVWPRRTAASAHHYAELVGGEICDELFVPLATERFASTINRLLASRAEGVLMLLVGQDAVHFNRAFADAGLDQSQCRLSTLVDENTLLASGADGTHGLCATAAYFESLVTPEGLAFGARYAARFGPDAPTLNSPGESCYEGMLLLNALARRAGSLDVGALSKVAPSVEYEGPRGGLHLRDRHLQQRVYLAEAEGLEFDVVAQL